ncbi:hypothetical protein CLAN_0586 [Campylobacter lanienae NCTC 13004]|uniref:Uncharacterized protein n=1 Tax=Campylobacter lanienae NCTC 13004 TaxID=1031753 RepID=A0A1X9SM76_9BACT|nr:hypothetical protein [Campylobacter lanienae]ARQ97335.1 hypothetical protein CLAN_0586 [Campylobacter lanienae NCTC 13004]
MSDKNAKKFIFISLLYPLPFVVIILGLIYIYDPFQIFHKPYFREATFFTDMRKQALGIIKHYKFDSYIIGTSMLENTDAKEATNKLNSDGKWINISLSGSTFNQRAMVLDYIFQNQNPKHIIYSLDGYYMVNMVNRLSNSTLDWDFLYDNNPYNDIKLYRNSKFMICALKFSDDKGCVGTIDDIYQITNWYKEYKELFGGFDNWIKNKDNGTIKQTLIDIKNGNIKNIDNQDIIGNIDILAQQDYLHKYLIRFFRDYPNTKFSIIIPTYSRLFYRMQNIETIYNDNSKFFYTWEKSLRYFITQSSSYKNVKVYGFDELDYADDIANYRDLPHYNKDLNSIQLDAIKNQTNILTPQNIDKYLATLEQKIKSYDIKPFIKALENVEIEQIKQ